LNRDTGRDQDSAKDLRLRVAPSERRQSKQPHDIDPKAALLHAPKVITPSLQSPAVISGPLEQIRKRFIERCRGDLHRLRELRSSGAYRDSAEALSGLAGIAHSLAGAGGTLGFPEISSRAFEVESLLIEGKVDDRATSALDQLIKALETVSDPTR
jgi:HPt (histidine-containing phosphotransfer) domain-containing protein